MKRLFTHIDNFFSWLCAPDPGPYAVLSAQDYADLMYQLGELRLLNLDHPESKTLEQTKQISTRLCACVKILHFSRVPEK